MGVKKKNKVSAEFNMSSLTDIIFLLLIFFMLTSSLVTPNALNLSLPGTRKEKSPPTSNKLNQIKVARNGTYYLNGNKVSLRGINTTFRNISKSKGAKAVVTISPHKKASHDKVVALLNSAWKAGITASMLEPWE